ncbi:nucleotidyltransferase family protein [Hellea balneolensis]|uniref:nucleotidyltransferase family protein n=1 Tax=Hellea balneolensis TaxID=287478 RepID=UPI0004131725|nr:nucleotidyltransferase family protein [Hellea balneolensis]
MTPENCALIILASGLSKRFGDEDKLMANFRGKPLVQHAIDAAEPVAFAKRFAVIPKRSVKRRELFSSQGFSLIENENPEAGQGGSLKLAATTIQAKGYSAMCVMLGDMPFIRSEDISALLKSPMRKDRVISHCNNTLMPPAIFQKHALTELMSIESKSGAKALFKSGNVSKHPLSETASRDIDTPETLAELS